MEDLYHFSEFSFSGVEDKYSSSNDSLWATEGLNEVKKVHFSGAEDWGESSGFGFIPNDPTEDEGYLLSTKYHQQPSYEDYGPLDNLQFDMVSPPLQPYLGENIQFDEQNPTLVPLCDPTKDKYNSTHLTSLEILKNYGKGFKRLCDEGKNMQPVDDLALVKNEDGRKLSTEDVMRIAGTRFIESTSESAGLQSFVNHPFGLSFSELSDEEKEDVELAESLLAAAEKVGCQQFERASKLLSHCESLSSKTGNPVKRVVYYFAEALHQRIDRETGRVSSEDLKKMQSFDPEEAFKDLNPTLFAFDEMLPFCQVARFTAVQAIMENITEAKKIHIIDLEIRKGVQWLILMQSLESRHECPLELLKITAVGSGTTSIHIIEDTGKRLKDFAQSLNIPFSFNIVTVSDMLHLKEDLFERDPEETIAVYAPYALGGKIQQQNQLETIMRVVRTINPIVMVVAELEANHNSTTFVKRFIEALFYFSASFDCFATCMERDERRMAIESVYYRAIKNIVAAEGAERKVRYVKIDVWRAFFSRFGMEETELSMLSIYQADLVAKRFPFGSFCTFDRNGHCLLIGWKGTPFYSVSVWKFI